MHMLAPHRVLTMLTAVILKDIPQVPSCRLVAAAGTTHISVKKNIQLLDTVAKMPG